MSRRDRARGGYLATCGPLWYSGGMDTTTPATKSETVKVRLQPDQHKALQVIAARNDEPVSAVLRRAIREMIEREGGEK